MRLCFIALLACSAPSEAVSSPTEGDERVDQSDSDHSADSVDQAIEVDCPRPTLTVPAMALDQTPDYTRAMWLDDSLATTDLVVVGVALPDGLKVREVICGAIHEPLRAGDLLRVHSRIQSGEGVWMLVRTPRGYLGVNPETTPLPRREWDALAASGSASLSPELTEHETGHQLYRDYQRDGRAVRHGVEISGVGGDLHVVLNDHGERVVDRAFDSHGLERIVRSPLTGPGFSLQYSRGALWRFEHYMDRQLEGVSRVFRRGEMREEVHHNAGRRHGRTRTWDDEGQVSFDVTYDNGLIEPVVAYAGETGDATMHVGSDGSVSYGAPEVLIRRIRVGLRVRQVADLLRLPISPAMGVTFPAWRCEEALHVAFRRGRVVEIRERPNGAHCFL